MKRTLHLMGPLAGQIIDMADAAADLSVTDGWGRLVAGTPYPHNSSGILAKGYQDYPTSLKLWIASNTPIPPLDANEQLIPVTALTKALPTVVTVGAGDIGKFHNGNFVRFFRTGTLLDTSISASISSVGTPVNTFSVQINTTGGPNLDPAGVVINLST